MKTLLIILTIIIVAVITNPGKEKHVEVFESKISNIIQSTMKKDTGE